MVNLFTKMGKYKYVEVHMTNDRNSDDYCYYLARRNIKKYRKIAGLTAQNVADLSGFSHQFIRSLESLKSIKPQFIFSNLLYFLSKSIKFK